MNINKQMFVNENKCNGTYKTCLVSIPRGGGSHI